MIRLVGEFVLAARRFLSPRIAEQPSCKVIGEFSFRIVPAPQLLKLRKRLRVQSLHVATVEPFAVFAQMGPRPDFLDPLYRGNNTEGVPGYGIGLAVTQKIIALHAGTLDVASTIGEGTTVTITLPVLA